MKIGKRIFLSSGILLLAAMGATAPAQQTPFPLAPDIAMEPNGTLHFKDRTIPMPTLMSEQAKRRYLEILNRSLRPPGQAPAPQASAAQGDAGPRGISGLDAALKAYPTGVQDGEMGGVKVVIFTPSDIPARNRNRVVLALNSNAIGAIIASVAKVKVITPLFSGGPGGNTSAQVVAVYRELLKTHKPGQLAFIGISGGCQLSGNTTVWLAQQKLPMPGALGLMTCAGGGTPGDTRVTLDGLDPNLSGYTSFAAATRGRPPAAPRAVNPGDPPREFLGVAAIPKGFPPSYLLAGTRDLSLSLTVLLHRKLRNAGVVADLNIWEGMWHGFNFEPELPETREAAGDLARFLDRYMAT